MPVNRIGGSGVKLPVLYPAASRIASTGFVNIGAGPISLAAGQSMLIPSGQFMVRPGIYSHIQVKDPITGIWTGFGPFGSPARPIFSDGTNYRLINASGCTVGAFITNVGSGYTSAPTVTASSGSSTWTAIVGGAINSTVTITTAGAGYNYAPILVVSPPPAGGVQATATCTISAGAINAVTVVNQGAGYLVAPTITVLPDPREALATTPGPTTLSVLTVNATLAGSGTITAIVNTDPGTALTAVPTFTISGGGGASGAATAVMAFAVTGFTVGNAGVAYGNAQPFAVITTGGIVAGSAGSVVNPMLGPDLFKPRQANVSGTTTSGSVITATGAVVNDGGLFQAIPTGLVLPSGTAALPTTTAIVTMAVGGVTDTSFLYPM